MLIIHVQLLVLELPVRLQSHDCVSTDRVFRDRVVERIPKVR
jgi:hypothetical protein